MIQRVLYICILCLGLANAGIAAPNSPEKAIFFPQRAKLFCKETVVPSSLPDGRQVLQLSLPAGTLQESLRLSLEQNSVADMIWQQLDTTHSSVVHLTEELTTLRKEHAEVSGKLQATEARILFWSAPSQGKNSAAEMERIDTAMNKHLAELHADSFAYATREKALAQAIHDLEKAISRATANAQKEWQVTIPLADPVTGPVKIQYSYLLEGCGWQPAYRFDAHPEQKAVHFSYDAVIEQRSGIDWKNVAIALGTVEQGIELTPPQLPSWVVREQNSVVFAAEMARNAVPAQNKMMKGTSASLINRPIAQGTYMIWELGNKYVPAGHPIRLPVQNESWRTSFLYTVRPSRDSKAFLTAAILLPENRQLPQGKALFFANGALVGKRLFSLSGKEQTLFFGSDPLVTATMQLLKKQSGEQGILGRKQARTWAWDITCTNARNHPIALVVEEPEPQSEHEDIRIELQTTPEPTYTRDHKLIWKLPLAAGERKQFTHRVQVKAPRDMHVEFGRFQ